MHNGHLMTMKLINFFGIELAWIFRPVEVLLAVYEVRLPYCGFWIGKLMQPDHTNNNNSVTLWK